MKSCKNDDTKILKKHDLCAQDVSMTDFQFTTATMSPSSSLVSKKDDTSSLVLDQQQVEDAGMIDISETQDMNDDKTAANRSNSMVSISSDEDDEDTHASVGFVSPHSNLHSMTHASQQQVSSKQDVSSQSFTAAVSSGLSNTKDTNAIQQSMTMKQIIYLNQSVVNHYNSEGTKFDDNWALDTLQKAESIRCHLDDQLSTAKQQQQHVGMITRSFKKQKLDEGSSWTVTVSSSSGQHHCRTSVESNTDDVTQTYMYQRNDFDEGMHTSVDLESIYSSSFWIPTGSIELEANNVHEVSPSVKATISFNIGQVYRRKGDLDSASKHYERAYKALLQSNSSALLPNSMAAFTLQQYPIIIPILQNIGQLQYRRGDISLARETYTMALECAQLMYGKKHLYVASALNCLGVLHYHERNLLLEQSKQSNSGHMNLDDGEDTNTHQAMSLFQQALSIRMEVLGPRHADTATILNNIGRIHVQLDDFEQALRYYEDSLCIRRQLLGVNSLDYAATAFNVAQTCHQLGELSRAIDLYQEFLRVVVVKFRGRPHRDIAVVLRSIAQIRQEQECYDEAQDLYIAGLFATKVALGENHAEVAVLLNLLGNLYFETESIDDALRCYRQGLSIERAVLPPDHHNIVVTLSNLGEIYRQRNDYDNAAKMYREVLSILMRKSNNTDQIEIASTLSTIGMIHDQNEDTCISLHYLQKALSMRRRLLGNDHLDVSSTLVCIGSILYRKSIFSTALDIFSESYRIRQSNLGQDHRDVAFCLYNIGSIQHHTGCYEEANESYNETLRIEKLVLGELHKDVAMTLFKLGEVNKSAGNIEDSLRYFEQSLSVERRLSSSPSTDDCAYMARIFNEIGNIHLSRGDVIPMMEAFNESSRLYREAGLNPNNVVVSEHLYALECSFSEAAAAA